MLSEWKRTVTKQNLECDLITTSDVRIADFMSYLRTFLHYDSIRIETRIPNVWQRYEFVSFLVDAKQLHARYSLNEQAPKCIPILHLQQT